MTDDQQLLGWLALGLTLRLTPTAEGGRHKSVWGHDPYKPYSYRPNWGLPGMTGIEQAGAMVLSLGSVPFAPGDTTKAVIVPFASGSLFLWQQVKPGDDLRMFEGARICGTAVVEWVAPIERPLAQEDATRFTSWAQGQGDPP